MVRAGLYESRAKAHEAIAAGLVSVDGVVAQKPAARIAAGARLEGTVPYPWVSRGGVKLAAALDHFGLDPGGRTCLDIGASTGGFTDVLLDRGAARVYAVDVGTGQLHRRIACDSRVVERSETDVRALQPGVLDPPPSLIVCDVSFISLTLVLPPALALAAETCDLVALIKPQFEVGRGKASKGIVRDEELRRSACDRVAAVIAQLGWRVTGTIPSPIAGREGNVEFLIGASRP